MRWKYLRQTRTEFLWNLPMNEFRKSVHIYPNYNKKIKCLDFSDSVYVIGWRASNEGWEYYDSVDCWQSRTDKSSWMITDGLGELRTVRQSAYLSVQHSICRCLESYPTMFAQSLITPVIQDSPDICRHMKPWLAGLTGSRWEAGWRNTGSVSPRTWSRLSGCQLE